MFPKKKKKLDNQAVFELIRCLYNSSLTLTPAFREALLKAASDLDKEADRQEAIMARLHPSCQAEYFALSPNSPEALKELYQLTLAARNRYSFWSNLHRIGLF